MIAQAPLHTHHPDSQVLRAEPLWFPLVKRFYQDHYPSGRPNKSEPIWVLKVNQKIAGAFRLKPFPDETQLLTSMIIDPALQGTGLGSYLLQACRASLDAKPTYCFAEARLAKFYQQNGFIEVSEEDLPERMQSRFVRYRHSKATLTPFRFGS